MIKITNPIWATENGAYLSISKWNFDNEGTENVVVKVYKDKKFIGKATINRKNWVKTAKQKEKKVVFRPDDPMIYYYNNVLFEKPLTEDEKLRKLSIESL
jgi:hypothetical protein